MLELGYFLKVLQKLQVTPLHPHFHPREFYVTFHEIKHALRPVLMFHFITYKIRHEGGRTAVWLGARLP